MTCACVCVCSLRTKSMMNAQMNNIQHARHKTGTLTSSSVFLQRAVCLSATFCLRLSMIHRKAAWISQVNIYSSWWSSGWILGSSEGRSLKSSLWIRCGNIPCPAPAGKDIRFREDAAGEMTLVYISYCLWKTEDPLWSCYHYVKLWVSFSRHLSWITAVWVNFM